MNGSNRFEKWKAIKYFFPRKIELAKYMDNTVSGKSDTTEKTSQIDW